jgi:phosphoribosylamine---glycine ligase
LLFNARLMKLLVIGSGGREHALVWKLAQSPHVSKLWCAPGNAGIAEERLTSSGENVQCVPTGADDLQALLAFASEHKPDLTVVGPDNPLALGVVDLFQEHGFRIWGPNRMAARFEGSKIFSQQFMEKYGIPTARGAAFEQANAAKDFARSLNGRCAVKADGLALGKGVIICNDLAEASAAIDQMLVNKSFGDAGAKIVIQELLEGIEVSLHAMCDGRSAKLFPTAQDHKRIEDGDQGLNTGGMGAYSPAPFLSGAQLSDVVKTIFDPWLKGCAQEGIDYRGVLYPGLMLTREGPKVIEFNVRMGDPEAQVYLTRLDADLLELIEASLSGKLDRMTMHWRPGASVCVVMAAEGYPGTPVKGKLIRGVAEANQLPHTKVFHAGTARRDEGLVTNGGRVLGVTAWGDTLLEARNAAYRAVEKIEFDGAKFRRDIAAKALS